MTISVTMLTDRLGEDGSLWTTGNAYSATEDFARSLVHYGFATASFPPVRQTLPTTFAPITAAEVAAGAGVEGQSYLIEDGADQGKLLVFATTADKPTASFRWFDSRNDEYADGPPAGSASQLGTVRPLLLGSTPTSQLLIDGDLDTATDQPIAYVRLVVNPGTDAAAATHLRAGSGNAVTLNPGEASKDLELSADLSALYICAFSAAAVPDDYDGGAWIASQNEEDDAAVFTNMAKLTPAVSGVRRLRVACTSAYTLDGAANTGATVSIVAAEAPNADVVEDPYAGITNRWMWLPFDDGTGVNIEDQAGIINGNGTDDPMFTDSLLPLAGTPNGGEWTTEPGVFTGFGPLYYQTDNAKLWEFCDWSTLTGTMHIAFRAKFTATTTVVEQIIAPYRANADTGGWMVRMGTSGQIQVAMRALGSASAAAAFLSGPTRASAAPQSFADNQYRNIYITITRDGDNVVGRLYIDGLIYGSPASPVLGGGLPPSAAGLQACNLLSVYASSPPSQGFGSNTLGQSFLSHFMMLRTDNPWDVSAIDAAVLEHHSAPTQPPTAWIG